jgi:hypothetical protein
MWESGGEGPDGLARIGVERLSGEMAEIQEGALRMEEIGNGCWSHRSRAEGSVRRRRAGSERRPLNPAGLGGERRRRLIGRGRLELWMGRFWKRCSREALGERKGREELRKTRGGSRRGTS